MSERPDVSAELAAYLVGGLDPAERSRFALLLEADPDLRAEHDRLAAAARLLETRAEPFDVPDDLEIGVRRAVARARSEDPGRNGDAPAPAPAPAGRERALRSGWPRRLALAGALAASLALAVFAGSRIADDGPTGSPGALEVSGALRAVDGGPAGRVEVRMLGIGREIALTSRALPILPKGEYYELWFVGPGDTLADPNRISAGTFHPDENGRSHVRFTAAVDPSLYPEIEVTAEPGDGNPRPSGEVVATLDSE
jgi:Anti-sigma-K factor rskA